MSTARAPATGRGGWRAFPDRARRSGCSTAKNLPAVGAWSYVHANLHGGGAQFTFLDGHSRRFSLAAYWNPATNTARTNNADLLWLPD
jgi:prepilin-type processing-associated H-X9-DG protein